MSQPASRPRLRDQHRHTMRQALIDAASSALAAGTPPLTMQRVAAEVGCSVGALYRYFPSKADLVTAAQHDLIERLHRAQEAGWEPVEANLRRATRSPAVAALARVHAASRFWIDAGRSLPRELDLARGLVTARRGSSAAAPATVDAAVRLTEPLAGTLAAAGERGVLDPGDPCWRTGVLVATLSGTVLAGALDAGDRDPTLAEDTAIHLLDCLLATWGAQPRLLRSAARAASVGSGTHRFAPLPDGEVTSSG